jgi:hypothetical protein
MPYKLRKAPGRNLYWVVSKETGRKHSLEPLPKSHAEAQMKALYARESGYAPLKKSRGKGYEYRQGPDLNVYLVKVDSNGNEVGLLQPLTHKPNKIPSPYIPGEAEAIRSLMNKQKQVEAAESLMDMKHQRDAAKSLLRLRGKGGSFLEGLTNVLLEGSKFFLPKPAGMLIDAFKEHIIPKRSTNPNPRKMSYGEIQKNVRDLGGARGRGEVGAVESGLDAPTQALQEGDAVAVVNQIASNMPAFEISVPEPEPYITQQEARAVGGSRATVRKPTGYKSPVIRQMYIKRCMEEAFMDENTRRLSGMISRSTLL